MKKSVLLIATIFIAGICHSQERFEVSAITKAGYYINKSTRENPYSPESAFSPGVGIELSYFVFEKTGVSFGMEAQYLSPDLTDFFGDELNVLWHSINFPVSLTQQIGEKIFVNGGIIIAQQFGGYWHEQKTPEFKWQAGIGWKFKKLDASLHYCRGFQSIEKLIKTSSSSYFGTEVKHQEIMLKLKYALWKF